MTDWNFSQTADDGGKPALPLALVIFKYLRAFALASFCTVFCCSCVWQEELAAQQKRPSDLAKTVAAAPAPVPVYWNENDAKGAPKIVVHLGEQRAFFFKGNHLIGESNISTGRKGLETPPGKYRVIQKDENHFSNLYGNYVGKDGAVVKANVEAGKDPAPDGAEFRGAAMPYFLRFTRGYGMHAGFVPRYRASHGCIRMPREMAKHFFDAAEMDTPVVVEE